MSFRTLTIPRAASAVSRRLQEVCSYCAASIEGSRYSGRDTLVIFDDVFPHASSGFRLAEFTAYLAAFPGSQVHSTGSTIALLEPGGTLATSIAAYGHSYPEYRGRVVRRNPHRRIDASLLYSIFISNTSHVVPVAEKYSIPFLFGLYPGGGFTLHGSESDRSLARICGSPQFAGVIATQQKTVQYLLEKNFCPPDQVHFIFGVPAMDTTAFGPTPPKRFRGIDKGTLDICFVAHKYTKHGRDKGYGIFVEVGKRLTSLDKGVRLHVVGPYDATDWDVSGLEDKISFYGLRSGSFFRHFYAEMDLILSPNVPFVLAPGAFDGFPLTTCVEAARNSVAVCCTDELGENIFFENGRDILIIPPVADEIAARLEEYLRDYARLVKLGAQGAITFRSIYSYENQIEPRLSLLARHERSFPRRAGPTPRHLVRASPPTSRALRLQTRGSPTGESAKSYRRHRDW